MGEDAGSVIASCAERLSALKAPIISNFLSYNEIHIGGFNSPKTALFISAENTGSPIDFVIPLIYTQLFDTMCDKCGN
jgi:type IV secretion system protein VirD4